MGNTAGKMTGEQQEVEDISNQVAEQTVTQSQATPPEPRPNVRPHNGPNLTPRAIAKAEIFVEGDYVVYPTHGVGKVERIAVEEIAGHRLELIHITLRKTA